jgi:hypothetical protein
MPGYTPKMEVFGDRLKISRKLPVWPEVPVTVRLLVSVAPPALVIVATLASNSFRQIEYGEVVDAVRSTMVIASIAPGVPFSTST